MTPTLHTFTRALGLFALATPLCAGPALAASGGLDIAPDVRELAWLLALFALLVWPAQRFVFAPLLAVLEARDARMDGARARAREVGTRGDAVMARYQQAVSAARREADGLREEQLRAARAAQAQVRADARAQAEAQAQRVREEVATAHADARRALREQGEALGLEVASRVLGRQLS